MWHLKRGEFSMSQFFFYNTFIVHTIYNIYFFNGCELFQMQLSKWFLDEPMQFLGAVLNGDSSIMFLGILLLFFLIRIFIIFGVPWYVNMAILQSHSIFYINTTLLFSYECSMCESEYGNCVLVHTNFIFFYLIWIY